MKKILFELERESILHAVKLEAYQAGEILKEGEAERVSSLLQASDDNDDVLNGYIDSAVYTLKDIMTGYLQGSVSVDKKSSVTEKGSPSVKFGFDTEFPDTYDENQNDSVLSGMRDYAIAYALWKWFNVNSSQKSREYGNELTMLAGNIRHRISQRVKPVRRRVPPMGF